MHAVRCRSLRFHSGHVQHVLHRAVRCRLVWCLRGTVNPAVHWQLHGGLRVSSRLHEQYRLPVYARAVLHRWRRSLLPVSRRAVRQLAGLDFSVLHGSLHRGILLSHRLHKRHPDHVSHWAVQSVRRATVYALFTWLVRLHHHANPGDVHGPMPGGLLRLIHRPDSAHVQWAVLPWVVLPCRIHQQHIYAVSTGEVQRHRSVCVLVVCSWILWSQLSTHNRNVQRRLCCWLLRQHIGPGCGDVQRPVLCGLLLPRRLHECDLPAVWSRAIQHWWCGQLLAVSWRDVRPGISLTHSRVFWQLHRRVLLSRGIGIEHANGVP